MTANTHSRSLGSTPNKNPNNFGFSFPGHDASDCSSINLPLGRFVPLVRKNSDYPSLQPRSASHNSHNKSHNTHTLTLQGKFHVSSTTSKTKIAVPPKNRIRTFSRSHINPDSPSSLLVPLCTLHFEKELAGPQSACIPKSKPPINRAEPN
jgi:hypothetical protein